MASKKVLDRQKSFAILESTFHSRWKQVLAGLKDRLGEDTDSPEELGRLPEALLGRLRGLLASLVKAQEALDRLEPVAAVLRKKMKAAAEALRKEILEIKDPLMLAYGERFEEVFPDLKSHLLRRDPDRLIRLGRFALEKLGNPQPGVAMREFFAGVMPEPQDYAALLEKKLAAFEQAHTLYESAAAELEAAKASRDEAREAYDATFPDSAELIAASFKISGNPEWTKNLRPSGREPGLLHSEVNRRRNQKKAGTRKDSE